MVQVRDEYRTDWDGGRGGFGVERAKQEALARRGEDLKDAYDTLGSNPGGESQYSSNRVVTIDRSQWQTDSNQIDPVSKKHQREEESFDIGSINRKNPRFREGDNDSGDDE
ncbi:hypothetical protein HK096_008418 [Nowakowskiella sp. JEL0078]|nr:hypothetical protein HK096_008418 [Nowakowskiella sp. JEL0078]